MKFESLHLIAGNWQHPGRACAFLHALRESGAPVILLDRRDRVARYLSHAQAEARQVFHSFEKRASLPSPRFTVDIADMRANAEAVSRRMAETRRFFAGHPAHLELAYEDLFEDAADGRFRPEVARRLAALLAIEDRFDRVPRLAPLSTRNSADPVINREEVEALRRALRASGVSL